MADAVTTVVVANTKKEYIAHLTNLSDGTGESAVIKVDRSTLTTPANAEPSLLAIEWIRWAIQGMTSVRLLWDHTTDDMAMILPAGAGYENFRGGPDALRDFVDGTEGLKDPNSSGGTGDLLLTTNGQVSGGSYDITIGLRLIP